MLPEMMAVHFTKVGKFGIDLLILMSAAASGDAPTDAAANFFLLNLLFASEPDSYPTPSFEWARRAHSMVVSLFLACSEVVRLACVHSRFLMLSLTLLLVAKPLLHGIDLS